MRLLSISLSFLIISIASGTITMSNEYFTSLAAVQEGLEYHNMNFNNNVFIGQDVIDVCGSAAPTDNGNSHYSDRVGVTSKSDGNTIAAHVYAKGLVGRVARQAIGGSSNSIGISFALRAGDVNAGSNNAYTQAVVTNHMENTSHYLGSIVATSESIDMSGSGVGTSYGNSGNISFDQKVWLSHMGKEANIDSGVKMIRRDGLKPVIYGWGSEVHSNASKMAVSRSEIQIAAGDCDANVSFSGTGSSFLKPTKLSQHIIPLVVNNTTNQNTTNHFTDPEMDKLIDLLKRSLVEWDLNMTYKIGPIGHI